jgi:hypothetical protein
MTNMPEGKKEKAWKELFKKLEESGYEKLNMNERVWLNIDGLIGDVNGGGLISFFYNHGADNYGDTIDDLNTIGVPKAIALVKKIAELFPIGKPSKNIEERNEVIDSWDHDELNDFFEELDNQFYEITDDIEKKLEPIIAEVIKTI